MGVGTGAVPQLPNNEPDLKYESQSPKSETSFEAPDAGKCPKRRSSFRTFKPSEFEFVSDFEIRT